MIFLGRQDAVLEVEILAFSVVCTISFIVTSIKALKF